MEKKAYRVWTRFYEAFADKLYAYREDRPALIAKIKAVYEDIGMKLPTLEKDGDVVDLDPFTVFGLFSKGLTDANRVKIITALAKEFSVQVEIPHDFAGIPVLNPLQATFYRFRDERGPQDIDHLWDVFCAAIDYARKPSAAQREVLINTYDTVMQQKGIKWNLSMGLYWIRPYQFMNLDSRNRWFILLEGKMPRSFVDTLGGLRSVPSGRDYLAITDRAKAVLESGDYPYHNFPELSVLSWRISEAVNQGAQNPDDFWDHIDSAMPDADVETVRYWLYSPGANACKWEEFYHEGIMAIGWGEVGDLTAYSSKEAIKSAMREHINPQLNYMHSAHATWQFANEMKVGDVVFVKRGLHTLIGKGTVASGYRYEDSRPDEFKHVRSVQWEEPVELDYPGQAPMKTLTDVTSYTEFVDTVLHLFEAEDSLPPQKDLTAYTREDFLSEVYVDGDTYDTLAGLLKRKQNLILQGAPGVGKTYAAKRLAYAYMGVKDPERVMMIQFHQSYSYEDFIMGFRPTAAGGFELKTGPFYNFCKRAEIDGERPYFFIIDEINRGNLSKIFGELFMLLEKDKRGIPLRLLYADELFTIPRNVYIIGMMNTSDRSLAMLDYALRRRFAFFELPPAFHNESFQAYQAGKENEKFDRLIATVAQLNEAITGDETLGRGFCIGHSYFCTRDPIDDAWLQSVVRYELIPLLEEYWFDEPDKVRQWSERLGEAIR